MCGICGIATLSGNEHPDPGIIDAMLEAERHRGPDGRGRHLGPGAALGHNRLSIIDLQTGDQPIYNEDRSVVVVFNGEIYNFQELRADLEAKGHRFSTRTDTEVLVHLWEERGEYLCESLTGMFAFALWDRNSETLFIGRDRTGQKPLYYMRTREGLAFASELKALRRHPDFSPDMDHAALNLFLGLLYVPAPWTIHRAVRKLPPAHNLIWKRRELSVKRYWSPTFNPDPNLDMVEWEREFWRLFRDAVRMQMISDVPLGAFLSGGIDSSLIVAVMSEEASKVKTFSMGFGDEINELPHAKVIAERFATEHYEFQADPNLAHLLEPLSAAYDEPYADTSNIPSYVLCKHIRKQVKVALNGDGGDELFGGYGIMVSYLNASRGQAMSDGKARLAGKLARALKGTWPAAAGRLSTRLWWRELGSILAASPAPYTDLVMRQYFTADERRAHIRPECFDASGEEAFFKRNVPEHDRLTLTEAFRTNYMEYLPGDLNVKMDIASMMNSLEVRSPFLDHHLADHAFRLPPEQNVDGAETKKLLRRISRGLLPASIADRPKQGFGVPVASWLKAKELKDAASDMLGRRDLPFAPEALEATVNAFYQGQDQLAYKVWQLLNFHFWQNSLGSATGANHAHA